MGKLLRRSLVLVHMPRYDQSHTASIRDIEVEQWLEVSRSYEYSLSCPRWLSQHPFSVVSSLWVSTIAAIRHSRSPTPTKGGSWSVDPESSTLVRDNAWCFGKEQELEVYRSASILAAMYLRVRGLTAPETSPVRALPARIKPVNRSEVSKSP